MEDPDVLGEERSEKADTAKGTATRTGWNGLERRSLRSKRWYDKISWQEIESRVIRMANEVFMQSRAEEIIQISAPFHSVSETGGTVNVSFTRLNPRPALGLQFDVVTEPVTAIRNVHYQSAEDGPPFVFGPGETVLNRTVPILNANIGAGSNRTFRVRIAPPPTVGMYTRGPISEALVTINGAGALGQNGVLQFSAPSYSIPETAGTDTFTVQVTRTATVSPGAAQVTVTSSNGTALSGANYTAVNQVLNWASGDSSQKSVPISVVNVGTQQGDRTFQLTLSGVTGATIGTVGVATISILDRTLPPAPPVGSAAYPLTGGYHIGDPHDNSSSAVLDKMQMRDMVIYGTLPTRSGGIASYQSGVAALKARNPGCRVYLYFDPQFLKRSTGTAFYNNLISYMQSQTGVPSLNVPPNDWISQTPGGTQPIISFDSFHMYGEDNAVSDPQGRKTWGYVFQYIKENILDVVPSADGLYIDDFLHRPFIDGIVWQSNNQAVSSGDLAKRASVRAGQRRGITHFKTLTNKRIIANLGGWVLEENVNLVPEMAQLQMDGYLLENRMGRPLASYGLDVQGASVVANGSGNFATGFARSRHALYADQNFRLRPPEGLFVCHGMTAANRAGSGRTAGYRYSRYCMGLCWILHDLPLHLHDKTGDVSYSASASAMSEFDEYFGGDLVGMSRDQKFANRKWMGLPLDPKQSAPTQQGCYRRMFENAETWMNPQGNGTKTLNLSAPSGGRVRRLISGSQDPAVNTGATVSSSYTLSDQNAILFRLDAP